MQPFHFNSGTRQNALLSPPAYLGVFTNAAVGESPTRTFHRQQEPLGRACPDSKTVLIQQVKSPVEKRNRRILKAGFVH